MATTCVSVRIDLVPVDSPVGAVQVVVGGPDGTPVPVYMEPSQALRGHATVVHDVRGTRRRSAAFDAGDTDARDRLLTHALVDVLAGARP